MKRQLIYISLFFSVALYSCKEDTITGEPPQENIPEDITELRPVENYPGLILRAEMYDIYKQRFEVLPVNSPAKKNKIVKAMFSDSETDKKNATAEFISYWKDYASRWIRETLERPEPDGVSLRGVWRCIHLYDIVKSFGYLKTGEENDFRTALVQAIKWAIGTDSKNPRIPDDYFRSGNIYTDVYLAAGLVGLTFYDQPQSKDWVNYALAELKWQLSHSVWDGCWHETPRYHAYTMKLMGQFMEVLYNRTGIDMFQHEKNKELAYWFVRFNSPRDKVAGLNVGIADGVKLFPGLGDAAWGENLAPVNQYASHYAKTDPKLSAELMWLWSLSGYMYSEEPVLDLLIDRSLPVTAPQNMGSDICPQRGYILMRDKFETDDEIWFLLKCGKTSMHDHADKNSFSLIAYGTPMALDAGAADYNDPGHKNWNKKSISHNIVTFRNKGETDINKYDSQNATDGIIVHWDSQNDMDYSVTDASKAAKVSKYMREVIFVKPDYFVIRDQVNAAAGKEAVWMMQTPCDDIQWEEHNIYCRNFWGTALDVHVVSPSTVLAKHQSPGHFGTWTEERPDRNTTIYPFKYQQTIQFPAPATGNIVTVLHPMKDGTKRLSIASRNNGQILNITKDGRQDQILFTEKGINVTIGSKNIISEYK